MKRILIFSVAYEPFVGGAEIAVREITRRIPDIEFDLITLNLDGKQQSEETKGNVHVYRIGTPGRLSKLLYPIRASRLGLALHAKNKYDAIWSIMASFSGFAALFFKRQRPEVPFILTLQEGDPIRHIKRRVWPVYPLFKQIFRRADKIQAISAYLARFGKDMGAISEPVVIPNGVDIENFTKQIPENIKQELGQKLGKNPGDVFLVTTSRLVKKNGISDVIAAMTFLPERIKFLVIGTGELEDELKKKVEHLHLAERVKFLGEIAHAEIPTYLSISDIFIRPSLSEGLGNSFIEAMAAGIPVIATPVGGIPDFITDKETGFFCKVGDPASIADKVMFMCDNPERAINVTEHAKALVQLKYDWNLVADRMKKEIF